MTETRRDFLRLGGVALIGLVASSVSAQEENRGSFIFAHGAYGSAFARNLESAIQQDFKMETYFPSLPFGRANVEGQSGIAPDTDTAIAVLAEKLNQAKRPRILAGHSFGAFVALATVIKEKIEVDGLVLGAMRFKDPSQDPNSLLAASYNKYWPIITKEEVVKNNIGVFVIIHDRGEIKDGKQVGGDEQVKKDNSERIETQLGAIWYPAPNRGHLLDERDSELFIGAIKQYLLPQFV